MEIMENFYKKHFISDSERVKVISLEDLKELKDKGITTEQFLDYLCEKQGFLLHGSIHNIEEGKLTSSNKKVFAANKAVIAIMRSLYSNRAVNLQYPYFISEKEPLVLKIHTQKDRKFTKTDKGFVYVVKNYGFKNDPEGSWQFVRPDEIKFVAVIEIENSDFTYPVEFFDDFNYAKE